MRVLSTLLLAGAAAALVVGVAAAEISKTHILTLRLPDGGVEQIRYTGDVAPNVSIEPGAPGLSILSPDTFTRAEASADNSPFAALERASTEMDRQATAMLRQVFALQARAFSHPDDLTDAGAGAIPAGAEGYSVVSTTTGSGVCVRSVEITSNGADKTRVVRRTSGDCGVKAAPEHAQPAAADAVKADKHPGTTT